MSEQQTEAVELPSHGDAAFSALMDALAPEKEPAAAGTGDPPAGAAGAAGGGAAPAGAAPAAGDAAPAGGGAAAPAGAAGAPVPTAGDGTGAGDPGSAGATPGSTGAPATGDAGAGTGGADGAPGSVDRPAAWTASASEYQPRFAELSNAIETKHTEAFQTAALEEVQEEHAAYFEALEQHPRLLVGQQVPALDREGMETLSNTDDAREWQDAVKTILVDEVRDRAQRAMEENDGFLTTIHSSIDLFANNIDLIPGTKEFDVDLANRFATLATPYELRVDDKLQGYSIPVQPIIDQLRQQLVSERAKSAAAAPAATGGAGSAAAPAAGGGSSPATTPAAPAPPADAPQAGIQSKAGQSDSKEDFSTLFGTIGLPNLQI